MRALYGLIVCGAIGMLVSLFTKPKSVTELVGLVTGTELDAMRMYKGGEINRAPGRKARGTLKVDPGLGGSGVAVLPPWALERMAARPGDIVYVSDRRWWFGGLRSVHLKAGEPGPEGEMRIGPDALATAHLHDGQQVVVEKII
jgi:hypothetical protein